MLRLGTKLKLFAIIGICSSLALAQEDTDDSDEADATKNPTKALQVTHTLMMEVSPNYACDYLGYDVKPRRSKRISLTW